MHLLQLAFLLKEYSHSIPILYAPFLPYGRQDKDVDNESTFAAYPVMQLLVKYYNIETFDCHSPYLVSAGFVQVNYEPTSFFNETLYGRSSIYDVVCFPDKGAKERYLHIFLKKTPSDLMRKVPEFIYLDKVRDQLTGEIKGLELSESSKAVDLKDKKVIIFDDICDGGRTFIEVVKVLKSQEILYADLCVSHGIFSKGTDVLYQGGIRDIFTTNSLKHNIGFDVLFEGESYEV